MARSQEGRARGSAGGQAGGWGRKPTPHGRHARASDRQRCCATKPPTCCVRAGRQHTSTPPRPPGSRPPPNPRACVLGPAERVAVKAGVAVVNGVDSGQDDEQVVRRGQQQEGAAPDAHREGRHLLAQRPAPGGRAASGDSKQVVSAVLQVRAVFAGLAWAGRSAGGGEQHAAANSGRGAAWLGWQQQRRRRPRSHT